MTPFERLLHALQAADYDTTSSVEQGVRFVKVKGRNIRGGFCEANDHVPNRYLDGRLAADHVDCFDKWSTCPMVVKLPDDGMAVEAILRHLEFLSSDEGRDWSNSYGYYDDPKLPREVD